MPSWVIIGVSRGIGYQFLRTLSLDPSNTVIGIARTPAPVAAQVTSDALPNVHILPGDLTSYTSLAEAAALVAPLTGGVLDHLIINGVYHNLATLQLSPADYISKESLLISEVEKSMLTNALGPFFAIQAFMPLLLKGAVKKVVAISSAVADTEMVLQAGMGDGIPYAVSKAALNMLVAKCAVTYGKQGVKVLAINPGFVYTMGGGVEDMPEEVKPLFDEMATTIRKFEPSFTGPIMPEESVEAMLKVIEGLTMEQSGLFLGHRGDKRWV